MKKHIKKQYNKFFSLFFFTLLFLNTITNAKANTQLNISQLMNKYSVEELDACLDESEEIESDQLKSIDSYQEFQFLQTLSNSDSEITVKTLSTKNNPCFKDFLDKLNAQLKEVNPLYDIFSYKLNLKDSQASRIGAVSGHDRNFNLYIYQSKQPNEAKNVNLGISWTHLSGEASLSLPESIKGKSAYKEIVRQVIHEYYMLRDKGHDIGNLFSDNEYSCIQTDLSELDKSILANYRAAKFENALGLGKKLKNFNNIKDILANYSTSKNIGMMSLYHSMDDTRKILMLANKVRCEKLRETTAFTFNLDEIVELLTTPHLNFGDITFTSIGPGCESCAGSGWYYPDGATHDQ